jgi:hypothetical protein
MLTILLQLSLFSVFFGMLTIASTVTTQPADDHESNGRFTEERFLQYYYDVTKKSSKASQQSDVVGQMRSLGEDATPSLENLLDDASTIRGAALNRVVAFIGVLDSKPVVGFEKWSSRRGNQLEFVFQSFHHTKNDDATFLVDFGDGTGKNHRVKHGSSVFVSYESPGEKFVTIQSTGAAPQVENARALGTTSVFVIQALVAPSPDETWTESTSKATVHAYIFRSPLTGGVGNLLRKPLLIVEGFDPNNNNPTEDIFDELSNTNTWNLLHENGWDIIIVDQQRGAIAIQENALALRLIIERVRANKHPLARTVLLGVVRFFTQVFV